METYFKLKIIIDYIIPLSILGLIILSLVIMFCTILQHWINKRRNKNRKENV